MSSVFSGVSRPAPPADLAALRSVQTADRFFFGSPDVVLARSVDLSSKPGSQVESLRVSLAQVVGRCPSPPRRRVVDPDPVAPAADYPPMRLQHPPSAVWEYWRPFSPMRDARNVQPTSRVWIPAAYDTSPRQTSRLTPTRTRRPAATQSSKIPATRVQESVRHGWTTTLRATPKAARIKSNWQ